MARAVQTCLIVIFRFKRLLKRYHLWLTKLIFNITLRLIESHNPSRAIKRRLGGLIVVLSTSCRLKIGSIKLVFRLHNFSRRVTNSLTLNNVTKILRTITLRVLDEFRFHLHLAVLFDCDVLLVFGQVVDLHPNVEQDHLTYDHQDGCQKNDH